MWVQRDDTGCTYGCSPASMQQYYGTTAHGMEIRDQGRHGPQAARELPMAVKCSCRDFRQHTMALPTSSLGTQTPHPPPPPRPVSRRCLHHTRVATSSSSSNNSIYQIITATAAECQGELKPVETASFANSRSKVQTSHSSLKGAQASEF